MALEGDLLPLRRYILEGSVKHSPRLDDNPGLSGDAEERIAQDNKDQSVEMKKAKESGD